MTMRPAMGARTGPAVFLVSAAMLAFEVLLLRLFAIEQVHHFAYMALGMALLGFGASGTALALARPLLERHVRRLLEVAAVALTIALIIAVPLAHASSFDATQIIFDAGQWASLAGLYASLSLPFLCGAAVVALALMDAGSRVGRLYAASMLGSGAGALLALLFLATAPPARAVAAPALLAAAAASWLLMTSARRGTARTLFATGLAILAVAATLEPPWSLRVTPFKGLPQVEAFAAAERVGERWSPVGWTVAVRAPAFRHAPGLSLAFPGELPAQTALFVDGETAGAATDWGETASGPAFLDWTPLAAPYAVGPAMRVLVLGSGDGLEVLNALTHGASHVTAVELNGPLVGLADSLAPFTAFVEGQRVDVVIGDARTFVAGTPDRFDLVVLPLAGAFNATAAGIHGSGEDYLNTVEAYGQYLRALAPGGILAITRWVRTPPRDNVKAILTAAAALRRSGVDDVGGSLAFVRSWAAATLLVRPDGFTRPDIDALRAFSGTRFFDLDWPDGSAGEAFNLLDRPVFTEAAAAAAAGGAALDAFVGEYPFDLRPATDDRPFFGRFVRLAALPGMLRAPRGDWLPFAEWGHLALLATLAQSTLLAALLLLVPAGVAALRRRRTRRASATYRRAFALAGYFAAIGFAYMFVEIAAIQRLTLVLGHPVYSAAAVLAAFLTFSGIGSMLSDRLASRTAPLACAGVGVIALVVALLPGATAAMLGLPLAARAGLVVIVLAPLAASMGMPFPLGLRSLAGSPGRLAHAWAVNGFASVVATTLAVLFAMEAGTRALLAAGAFLYLAAAWIVRRATLTQGSLSREVP